MDEQELTPQVYDALPLGVERWTFQMFGNVTIKTVQAHCKNSLLLTDFEIGKIEDAWARHPKRFSFAPQG
jgi:hypothetical protein